MSIGRKVTFDEVLVNFSGVEICISFLYDSSKEEVHSMGEMEQGGKDGDNCVLQCVIALFSMSTLSLLLMGGNGIFDD